jgi:septum formation protein
MSTKTTLNAGQPAAAGVRPLVLASTSRYRHALLARLGHAFVVADPAIDETPLPDEKPSATALRLAEAKARAVATRYPSALVIGSDQVADCDGQAVGKPGSRAAAIAQLAWQAGRSVVFHTGVALVDAASGRVQTRLVDVTSRFRPLSPVEIEHYVDRERPWDCAGSVKSEGLGIALFDGIESDDPTALVGLPLIAVAAMLRAEGFDVVAPPGTAR